MAVGGEKSALRLVIDERGGVFLGWLEGRFAPRVSHVLARGTVDPGWPSAGRHVEDPTSGSFALEMVADGREGVFMAWQRQREFPNPYDMIRMQRLWRGGIDIKNRG